jgi:hypothetical protein
MTERPILNPSTDAQTAERKATAGLPWADGGNRLQHGECRYCGQSTDSTDFPSYYMSRPAHVQHRTAHCVSEDRS